MVYRKRNLLVSTGADGTVGIEIYIQQDKTVYLFINDDYSIVIYILTDRSMLGILLGIALRPHSNELMFKSILSKYSAKCLMERLVQQLLFYKLLGGFMSYCNHINFRFGQKRSD